MRLGGKCVVLMFVSHFIYVVCWRHFCSLIWFSLPEMLLKNICACWCTLCYRKICTIEVFIRKNLVDFWGTPYRSINIMNVSPLSALFCPYHVRPWSATEPVSWRRLIKQLMAIWSIGCRSVCFWLTSSASGRYGAPCPPNMTTYSTLF